MHFMLQSALSMNMFLEDIQNEYITAVTLIHNSGEQCIMMGTNLYALLSMFPKSQPGDESVVEAKTLLCGLLH